MTNQLKRLFILFSVMIFLMLVSFSLIAYFSLSTSIHYQQQLESSQKIAAEKKEHFVNDNQLSLNEKASTEEEPVLYFITENHRIIKTSAYGHALINELYHKIPTERVLKHKLYSFDNRHFTVASSPVGSKNHTYWIYTIHDSTEAYHGLKQLRVTLISLIIIYLLLIAAISYFFARKAIAPYEESIDRERQFIQDATHELKTPLAVMHSATDVIKLFDSETLSEPSSEALHDLRTEISDMNLLITDLTQLSKKVSLVPIDLSAVVDETAKRLHIKTDIDSLIYIHGDSQSIKRLIYIAVDNARKYNDDVEVRLSLKRVASSAELTIKDNGSGVSPDALPYVFDRFYRAAGQQHIAGSGIGLSLLYNIAEQHKGQVRAFNDNGFVLQIKFPEI